MCYFFIFRWLKNFSFLEQHVEVQARPTSRNNRTIIINQYEYNLYRVGYVSTLVFSGDTFFNQQNYLQSRAKLPFTKKVFDVNPVRYKPPVPTQLTGRWWFLKNGFRQNIICQKKQTSPFLTNRSEPVDDGWNKGQLFGWYIFGGNLRQIKAENSNGTLDRYYSRKPGIYDIIATRN